MTEQHNGKTMEKRLAKLLKLITELQEEDCLNELRSLVDAGVDPKILLSCCMEGMRRIGERFEEGTYFIAALIMAGEIMRAATEILSPGLTASEAGETEGRIMLEIGRAHV
jgi:methanogenic corrinoid protein MtbC1